ncbi:MAG: hypothetical protein LUG91_07675 [Ruminococcus sp.]|nr:hypothetical protein [Ruminococcus sp.]
MFCSKCGNQIRKGERICGQCRNPISFGGENNYEKHQEIMKLVTEVYDSPNNTPPEPNSDSEKYIELKKYTDEQIKSMNAELMAQKEMIQSCQRKTLLWRKYFFAEAIVLLIVVIAFIVFAIKSGTTESQDFDDETETSSSISSYQSDDESSELDEESSDESAIKVDSENSDIYNKLTTYLGDCSNNVEGKSVKIEQLSGNYTCPINVYYENANPRNFKFTEVSENDKSVIIDDAKVYIYTPSNTSPLGYAYHAKNTEEYYVFREKILDDSGEETDDLLIVLYEDGYLKFYYATPSDDYSNNSDTTTVYYNAYPIIGVEQSTEDTQD